MRVKLLLFTVDCSRGPRHHDGQTLTTSSPVSSAYAKAARSASVLDRKYQP